MSTVKVYSQSFEEDRLNCVRVNRHKTQNFQINNNPLLKNYDIHYYHLDVHLENNSTYIEGFTLISFSYSHHQLCTQ